MDTENKHVSELNYSIKLTSLEGQENKKKVDQAIKDFFVDLLHLENEKPLEPFFTPLSWFVNEILANAIKAQQVFTIGKEENLNVEDLEERKKIYTIFNDYKKTHSEFMRGKTDSSPINRINNKIIAEDDEPLLTLAYEHNLDIVTITVNNWTPLSPKDAKRFQDRIAKALEKEEIIDEKTGEKQSVYKYNPLMIDIDDEGGGANFGLYSAAQGMGEVLNLSADQIRLAIGKQGNEFTKHNQFVAAILEFLRETFVEKMGPQ